MALLVDALPRFHPFAALCEDGLLLLFSTFAPHRLVAYWVTDGVLNSDKNRLSLPSDHVKRQAIPGLVELRGLEPLTLSMPLRCAPSCATAPHHCLLSEANHRTD